MRILIAVCLAVAVSFGASAAEQALTGSQVKGFLSSFPELKTFAEKRRIDFEKNRNRQRPQGQNAFGPFSQGVGELRAAGAYGEANRIVRRHGFSSMESWAGIARAMGAEGVTIDQLEDVGPALQQAVDQQMNNGKTTVLEIMCTRELGDPFRRDALAKPIRFLDKYKDYV